MEGRHGLPFVIDSCDGFESVGAGGMVTDTHGHGLVTCATVRGLSLQSAQLRSLAREYPYFIATVLWDLCWLAILLGC
jgi:hypothetical protein